MKTRAGTSGAKNNHTRTKMKKYIQPEIRINAAETSQMMAVSIVDGNADSSKPVLTKEDKDWNIWSDEAE